MSRQTTSSPVAFTRRLAETLRRAFEKQADETGMIVIRPDDSTIDDGSRYGAESDTRPAWVRRDHAQADQAAKDGWYA